MLTEVIGEARENGIVVIRKEWKISEEKVEEAVHLELEDGAAVGRKV